MKFIKPLYLLLLFPFFSQSQTSRNVFMSPYYLVKEPSLKSANPPLIILLHGYGSNEKDLFSFANQLPPQFLVVSVQAPNSLGNDSYCWYQMELSAGHTIINETQEKQSRQLIIDFISYLYGKHPYDKSKVYLCGFSQGGIMSYSIALTHPELIKGIAVMSGRLLQEVKPLIATSDKLKNIHLFISHGTSDGTLPITNARESVAYLKTLHLNPEYHEYPAGHTINNNMFEDFIKWLKSTN